MYEWMNRITNAIWIHTERSASPFIYACMFIYIFLIQNKNINVTFYVCYVCGQIQCNRVQCNWKRTMNECQINTWNFTCPLNPCVQEGNGSGKIETNYHRMKVTFDLSLNSHYPWIAFVFNFYWILMIGYRVSGYFWIDS